MNRTTILAATVLSLGLWGLSLQAAEKPAQAVAVPANRMAVLGDAAHAIPDKDIEVVSGSLADRSFKKGTVYVIEFWASRCPFSLQAIPRLNKIQKDFGGKVVVIGVSDEQPERIREAMRPMEEPAEYVLLSDPKRHLSTAYMAAFRQKQRPVAFIVDKNGKVVWFGAPADMDAKVKETVEAR